MFVKVKRVRLKSGKVQDYYYFAKSIRVKGEPRQIIIKYLGKTVPREKKIRLTYF